MMSRQLPASVDSLRDVEFRVFSQFGDDGIIQYLLRHVGARPREFIEFGVETYRESNTRFLLVKRQLARPGHRRQRVQHRAASGARLYWRHDLSVGARRSSTATTSTTCSATPDSPARSACSQHRHRRQRLLGLGGDRGASTGGRGRRVQQRLRAGGARSPCRTPATSRAAAPTTRNLFFGASLAALCDLGQRKGYAFVGSNSAGNNAYFVRTDRLGDLPSLSAADGYVESRFRESRDEAGNLTHLAGRARLDEISHLTVHDLVTGTERTLREVVGDD